MPFLIAIFLFLMAGWGKQIMLGAWVIFFWIPTLAVQSVVQYFRAFLKLFVDEKKHDMLYDFIDGINVCDGFVVIMIILFKLNGGWSYMIDDMPKWLWGAFIGCIISSIALRVITEEDRYDRRTNPNRRDEDEDKLPTFSDKFGGAEAYVDSVMQTTGDIKKKPVKEEEEKFTGFKF